MLVTLDDAIMTRARAPQLFVLRTHEQWSHSIKHSRADDVLQRDKDRSKAKRNSKRHVQAQARNA